MMTDKPDDDGLSGLSDPLRLALRKTKDELTRARLDAWRHEYKLARRHIFDDLRKLSDCGSPDGQPEPVRRLTWNISGTFWGEPDKSFWPRRFNHPPATARIIRFPVERTRDGRE